MKKRIPNLPSVETNTPNLEENTQDDGGVTVLESVGASNILDESAGLVYESTPAPITISIPFGRPPSPNESARIGKISVKDLTTHQRYSMLCLRDGLSRAGAKLNNGTPVDRPSHVIKYLLEQAIIVAQSSEPQGN